MLNTESPAPTYVGNRVRKLGGFRHLTGRTRFVDDIELPGMAHLAVLRSTEAHARLARVDGTEARAASGVLAVLTGRRRYRSRARSHR